MNKKKRFLKEDIVLCMCFVNLHSYTATRTEGMGMEWVWGGGGGGEDVETGRGVDVIITKFMFANNTSPEETRWNRGPVW